MKGFLVFCAVVVVLGLLGISLPYLKEQEREQEERLVGALNFTEDAAEAALDLRASLYKPSIEPGPERGQWVVSGIMVTEDSLTDSSSAPYSAVLESLCPDPAKPSCWRMIDLTVDGRRVEAVRLAGTEPPAEPAAEASEGAGANGHQADGETAAQGPAAESAGEMAVPAEAFDATSPNLAVQAVEAEGAPLVPATPASAQGTVRGSAQAAESALTGGSEAAAAPDEPDLSNQDLIRFVQDALTQLRYEPGPTDGKLGPQTANAIRAYQRDFRLDPDGRPSVELLRHLRDRIDDLGQQTGDPTSNGAQPSG